MGEYATRKSDGQNIKIGTCDSMYYMRASQIEEVSGYDFASCLYGIRFRFPFPDEDGRQVGDLDEPGHDFDRAVRVDGVTAPKEIDHYSVQFKADNGYLMSVQCPESLSSDKLLVHDIDPDAEVKVVKVHKNGYGGAVGVHSQKWVAADEDGPERLVTVMRCLGCGSLYRLHDWSMAEEVVVALRSAGQHKMADRVTAGYMLAAGVVEM
jgi:hypothetical protein